MDELGAYQQFEKFLSDFCLRKAEKILTCDDFDEKHSDSIRPLLEDILPTLRFSETLRLKTYFTEMLRFHIKGTLNENAQTSSQKVNATTSIITSSNSDVPFKKHTPIEADIQKGASQENTPSEVFPLVQRGTLGMQSTPLNIPIAAENQIRSHTEQPEYTSELADPFVNDIMAHINLSPIPQEIQNRQILSNPSTNSFIPPTSRSIENFENQSHSFLHNFAHLMGPAKRKKVRHDQDKRVPHQQLPSAEPDLPTPKQKRRRVPFQTISFWEPKEKNQMAKEYFPLLPDKVRNLIQRATRNDPREKEQSSIPTERIINLSNVIRSHVSERLSSVQIPGQGSFLPSPCTPQNLLRISQVQPFTPVRGDGSGQLLGLETEHINFQTRSIIRQQPLVTIPERDSLMPRLTNSLVEGVPFRESLPAPVQESEFTSEIPGNLLDIEQENINLAVVSENTGVVNLEAQPTVEIDSPHIIPLLFEQHDLSVQVQDLHPENISSLINNQADPGPSNWFDILRSRLDVIYPNVGGEKRKRKTKKRRFETDIPPRATNRDQDAPVTLAYNLPMIPNDIGDQSTDYVSPSNITHLENELRSYINLIKKSIEDPERTWEHFDPFLFSENDDFEMYTHIFKRIIKDDFVSMDTLYHEGTSRLDAARGFRLLLELQTLGLIEIFATGTRVESFKYIP